MSAPRSLPDKFCEECGHKVGSSNKSGLCASCAAEVKAYMPTPEEIAAECLKIQAEWGIERWQNGADDL